jgi:polysaccharide pyruvyl transferase WcaK-like protein
MVNRLKYYINIIKYEFILLPQLLRYLLTFKKKVIYVGCTGMGNLGDEAVYRGIEKVLGKNAVLYNILYSKPSAGKIGRKYFMKKPDYIMLGGGTIIKKGAHESYFKIFNDLHQKFPKSKLIVFGAGVADPVLAGEVGFPTDILSWSELLNKFDFIGVRGVLSQSLLKSKEWNVSSEVNVLHDPALFYANKELKLKAKSKKIGINICDIIGRIYGHNAVGVENFANQLISKLIKGGWEIYLYPTVNSDINYMKRIINKDLLKEVKIYKDFSNLKASLSFFDTIDLFVGERLHSIIFSSITYTPFHAIEYESKTSDYLLTLGLHGYSIRTDELNPEKCIERINYLYDNIHDEQKKLFDACQKARQSQLECSQKLIDKLKTS